jgi:alpha-galactosidase
VLTENQEKLHFGLWAIAKSPLILGTDMTTISESTLAIISNKVSPAYIKSLGSD